MSALGDRVERAVRHIEREHLEEAGRHGSGWAEGPLEVLGHDDRHGLGVHWLTVRVRLQGSLWRRFYVHRSGYLIEGGRGGARVYSGRGDPEHPYHTGLWAPLYRAMNIRLAASLVEAVDVCYRFGGDT